MKRHAFQPASLPLRAELSFAGVSCSLATNSPDVLTAFSRWISSIEARGPALALEVLVDSSAKRAADSEMRFRGMHHLVFATFSPGEVFVFDLLRRRISGVVSAESAYDADFWNTRIVPLTLGLMGLTVGVAPLHCACLDRGGEGLLLAGKSMSGKSTLAVSLSRRGFHLISDGWTYLTRERKGELAGRGIGAPVKLLPDAVSFFPELREHAPARAFNGEIAIEVDARCVLNAEVRASTRPRSLFLLERSEAPGCEFTPIGSGEVRDFFRGSVELLPPPLDGLVRAREEVFDALGALDCWKVRHGCSPDVVADSIVQLWERGSRAGLSSHAVSQSA